MGVGTMKVNLNATSREGNISNTAYEKRVLVGEKQLRMRLFRNEHQMLHSYTCLCSQMTRRSN